MALVSSFLHMCNYTYDLYKFNHILVHLNRIHVHVELDKLVGHFYSYMQSIISVTEQELTFFHEYLFLYETVLDINKYISSDCSTKDMQKNHKTVTYMAGSSRTNMHKL